MAQTTNGFSFTDCKVEYSTNGSDYTDLSGTASVVEGGDQPRISGEGYTFDGDTALVTYGKREPMELTFGYVHTEGTAEAWELLRPLFEGGSTCYFRWSPKGGNTDDFQYTTDAGQIIRFPYPVGDASSGDPVMGNVVFKTPKVTKSAVA